MTIGDVITRVSLLYNDVGFYRFTRNQYLLFLEEALAQLVAVRPDAHVKTETVTLVRGTRQELPADGVTLIDVYTNKRPDNSNGSAIVQIDKKDLNMADGWNNPSTSGEVREYAYDSSNPRVYWVAPSVSATGTTRIEIAYSYTFPRFVQSASDNIEIGVSDIFFAAIVSYCLYICYSSDSTSPIDRQVAQQYLSAFYNALSAEYKSSASVSPKAYELITVPSGIPATTGAEMMQGSQQ